MKKRMNKKLMEMTADEVMAHVFHPKVAEHLRKHVEKQHEEKGKPPKKS